MASLAMASSLAISMSLACANSANPAGSSASYTTLMSTSIPAPLRVSGAPRNLFTVAQVSPQGTQSTNLEETVQHAIDEAEEVCAADETSGNCAAAWDEVEELAATVAHKKVFDKQKNDPLEAFCKEVPESDECKVYED